MTPSTEAPTPATWTNWCGLESEAPSAWHRPADAAAVAALATTATDRGRRLRPIGSGHSFTGIATPVDEVLDLSGMRGLRAVDRVTGRVRVAAGTPLHELNAALDLLGLALPNLGDIDRQTIAGAVSTGTHGTGAGLPGIAAAITGFELVTAAGEVLWCDDRQHPDLFAAGRVGLGALGVLTEIELACVPAFRLRASERPERLEPVLEAVHDIAAAHRHFEFYWFPHTDRVLTKRNDLAAGDEGEALPRWRGWLDDEVLSNRVFGVVNTAVRARPGLTRRVNAVSARALSARTYTDVSHRVFCSPRRVRFVESEYAVPRASLVPVLTELRRWLTRTGEPVPFPVEVRFAAADDIWLSTGCERDNAYVAVHQFQGMPHHDYMAAFAAIAAEHEGRPHWGKLHPLAAEQLTPLYPRLDEFRQLRDRLDPARTFTNPYLDRVLGD
ncbi:D-arabinono-1,4-lactone oxidase [Janibacter sp. G1551]|uniref:D-arabinono-1,4-lactone oxidase n=1 Tax=Janibacter sp. G1551 TaxID=3420440 RepID=UPI003D00652F